MTLRLENLSCLWLPLLAGLGVIACSGDDSPGGSATGGATSSSGGHSGVGGGSPGSGGAPAGSGGMHAGGAAAGGQGTGGQIDAEFPFLLGADISSTQGQTSFVDVDGRSKSIFKLLKNHGFNYIRLKTFVDPTAADWGSCTGSESGSKEHVIEYGRLVKGEGMGFLLDFHYSDTWADPGNQIIPEAWRGANNPDQIARYVEEYTYDVISSAIAAGSRPDMVQIGNEITYGMLYSVPGPSTDCWGNDPENAPSGVAGWHGQPHFIRYVKAGIQGVRAADPTIEIMLHTERPEEARQWLAPLIADGVDVDVFGLSCYEKYQGGAEPCREAFDALIADSRFDGIDFVVAEYNPQRVEMNRMVKGLADGRGRGTFFWEPTLGGDWGPAMFRAGAANAEDFEEYDGLLEELGLSPW